MPNKIAFLHPNLGIGGAEQLIVNYAVALQQKKHQVVIYTPFFDPNHCFPETINGTLQVKVKGNIWPETIFGKFWALCAYIRMLIASLQIIFFEQKYDVIIVDQVSFCVPILRLFGNKVIFYCHFPDKLLCVERKSILKQLYRFILDALEEISLLPANLILVNSKYTKQVFQQNFKILKNKNPDILYPSVDFSKFTKISNLKMTGNYFLSINRYERKKNIQLAIQAFQLMQNRTNLKLIIAGGYDPKNKENYEYDLELKKIVQENQLENSVIFKYNISNEEKQDLISYSIAVLYTPENEHFGIVPIEAMFLKRPVIACNSGGPKESIIHEKSGYLLEKNANEWSSKMEFLADNKNIIQEMGKIGHDNVLSFFSFQSFQKQADNHINNVLGVKNK